MKMTIKQSPDKAIRLATFLFAEEAFGIDMECIREIMVPPGLEKLEPSLCAKGYFGYCGAYIPLVDLHKKFYVSQREWLASSRIVVCRADRMTIGFRVEAVLEMTTKSQADVEPAEEIVSIIPLEYIRALVEHRDRLLPILNIHRLIYENYRVVTAGSGKNNIEIFAGK